MLAENMKVTSEAVLASRQARMVILREITENMMSKLVQWQENREAERSRREDDMKELRATLVAGRAALKGEVGSLRQEAISALEQMGTVRQERVATLRSQLYGNMQTERKQLREWLFQQGKTRDREACLLRSELQKNGENTENTVKDIRRKSRQFLINTRYIRELKNKELNRSLHISIDAMRLSLEGMRFAVGQKRSMLTGDIAQARNEWLQVASRSSSGHVMATDMQKTAKIPAEEPVGTDTAPSAAEVLGDKIFAYIADHPDGVRAREMEGQPGVNRFKVMRALRILMEEGKVQKDGGLYFAR